MKIVILNILQYRRTFKTLPTVSQMPGINDVRIHLYEVIRIVDFMEQKVKCQLVGGGRWGNQEILLNVNGIKFEIMKKFCRCIVIQLHNSVNAFYVTEIVKILNFMLYI